MIHCSLSITIEWQIKSLAENKPIHLVVGNSTLMAKSNPHKEMFMLQEKNSFRPVYPAIVSGGFLAFVCCQQDRPSSLKHCGNACKKQYHQIPVQWSQSWPLVRIPRGACEKSHVKGAPPRPIIVGSREQNPGRVVFTAPQVVTIFKQWKGPYGKSLMSEIRDS